MDFPELTGVSTLPPSDLLLLYGDGTRRRFSCAPYLDKGVFARLRNPDLFLQARVASGTVCWPGGLDIAPETLFLKSTLSTRSETIVG